MAGAVNALPRPTTQRIILSARAFHLNLRHSGTISDLDGAEGIGAAHFSEALRCRSYGFVENSTAESASRVPAHWFLVAKSKPRPRWCS